MAQSNMYKVKYRHLHHKYNVKHSFQTRIISLDNVKSKENIVSLLIQGLMRASVQFIKENEFKIFKDERVL